MNALVRSTFFYSFMWLECVLFFSLASGAIAQDLDPANQQIVDWVAKYNAFGPDHQISSDMKSAIADRIASGESNIRMAIGPGLIGVKKPYLLVSYSDQFFVFPLTESDAKDIELDESGITVVSNKRQDAKQTPVIKISNLTIENSDSLPGASEIKGTVSSEQLGDISGKYAIRLHYSADQNTSKFFWLEEPIPAKNGTIAFHFAGVNKDVEPDKVFSGPLPIFIDLVNVQEKDGELKIDVFSNTVAKLLHIVSTSP